MKSWILVVIFSLPLHVSARVFSFNDTWLAAYIRGTGQQSRVSDDMWADSSGTSTVFQNKDRVQYNFSAEMGFLIKFSDSISVRFGIEAVQTREQTLLGRRDTTAEPLMTITSKAVGANPNITFEYVVGASNNFRTLFILGTGYSTIKATNEYGMTTAGNTLYSTTGDYKEVVDGYTLSYHGAVGFEYLLVDNVTILLELGYRQMMFDDLKYVDNYPSTVNGSKTSNSTAVDNTGLKDRELDMSGEFVGLSLRFYIPPIF